MNKPPQDVYRRSERQTAYDTIYYASLFHFVIIELLLVGVFGFLGLMDIIVVNSVSMLVIHAAALLISLAMWIIVATYFARRLRSLSATEVGNIGGSSEVQMRGSSLVSSASVYFLVATILHAVLLTAWIIWVANYNDLSPLNFNNNLGPFLIKRDLLLTQFLLVFIMFFYFEHDVRYQSLSAGVHALRMRSALSQSSAASASAAAAAGAGGTAGTAAAF